MRRSGKESIILIFIFAFLAFFVPKNANALVKVGILPYKIISSHYQRYSYISKSIPVLLSSDLSSTGISVARNSDINDFIIKNHITSYSSASLSKVSGQFGLKYLIFGRIIKIGNVFDIQTNIFSPADNKIVYRRSVQVPGAKFIIDDINGLSKVIEAKIKMLSSAKSISNHPKTSAPFVSSKTAPVLPSLKSSIFIKRFNQSGKGIIRTESKKYVIQALTAGRFLSSGIQAVVATRHNIILYNLLLNGKLVKVARYHLSARSNIVYVGIYKISESSNAIVLTKAKLGMIISCLLIYKNGKLIKATKNYNVFLRVMNINRKQVLVGQNPVSVAPSGRYFGDYVIGQNYYPIGQFGGGTFIYKFDKHNGSLLKTEALPFYKGITLYGTAYGNIKGDGNNYLLALSNSGNLMLINKNGKTIYTGTKTYGGSPLQIRVPSFNGSRSATYTGGMIYNVPAQLNKFYNKGKTDIIVLKNYKQGAFLHNLNYYTKSSIYSLVWNRIGFYPVWEIKPVAGYSAGFSIFKVNGKVYLADGIVKNPGSAFTKPKSYIIIYKIGD